MKANKNKQPPASLTALVVAASGGVGEAVARQLCAGGYIVIGTCRTAAQARQLKSRGVCHHALLMGLEDTKSINHGFREFEQLNIRQLDVLVYCAGVTHANPLEHESMDGLRTLFEINVFGALRLVQLAMPRLLDSHGRIVLIGSSSGGLGLPMMGAYSASKFALEGLADALRRELDEQQIGVSLVIPGGIKTPMTERHLTEIQMDIDGLDADTEDRYGKLYRRHQQLMDLMEMTAIAPDVVASCVLKAVTEVKPKARYFCSLDQTALRKAIRWLPENIWDDLLPSVLNWRAEKKRLQEVPTAKSHHPRGG